METDLLFSFLYENIKLNRIKREYALLDYSTQKEINRNLVSIKKIISKSVVMKFKIGNNFNLLIEDLPINFLLSHTIIIGDKAEIKAFRFKEEKEILYVAQKSLMDKLIDKVDLNSISSFSVRKLKGLKYHLEYNLPDIILKLKEYNKKIKNIDLNVIHMVQSDLLCNFVPTLNRWHLTIASRLKIELASLVDRGFIRDSKIDFFDEERQIALLNPFFVFEKETFFKFNKKTNERVYSDFSYEIFFYPNPEDSKDKINFSKQVSGGKEQLILNVQKIKKIKLSSINGTEILPLWVSSENVFLPIKNKLDFLEITGVNFEMEKNINSFEELFLQDLSGKKLNFCKKLLNDKYKTVFETQINKDYIFYKNIDELILKLNFLKEENISIVYQEEIFKEKIIEIEMAIRKLLHLTILESVTYNKLPSENVVKDTLLKYYSSLSSSIYSNILSYREFLSKEDLVEKTLIDSRRLLRTVKIQNIKYDYLFELNNCILGLIDVLSIFDQEKSKSFKLLFDDYFKAPKSKSYALRDVLVENLVESIVFANFIFKKYDIKILLKKEFDTELFSEDILLLNSRQNIEKYIVRPNLNVLKNIFPYSYNEAKVQIRSLPYPVIKYSSINIKGKIFPIKEDYYVLFCLYEDNFIEIFSNQYFTILRKRDTKR